MTISVDEILAKHLAWQRGDAEGSRADLTGAELRGADLRGAYMSGAYMRGADMTGASMRGASMSGADLRGADMSYADLTGADMTGARNVPAGVDTTPKASTSSGLPKRPARTSNAARPETTISGAVDSLTCRPAPVSEGP